MALNDGQAAGKAAKPKLELAKSKADRALDDYRKEAESRTASCDADPIGADCFRSPAPPPPADGRRCSSRDRPDSGLDGISDD